MWKLIGLLFIGVMLAGCASQPAEDEIVDAVGKDDFALKTGLGAIAGLLVDDRFRPIDLEESEGAGEFQAIGFILLQETGRRILTNANGEFSFVDLEPGTYTMRVSAEGHEAIPQKVQVKAGEFTEATVLARRTATSQEYLITTEYSVFIPCGYDYVANGGVTDCTFDQSGDSYRPGFTSDYSTYTEAAYLITEMRANQDYGYEVQIREDNGSSGGGTRYAVAQFQGDYVKILMEVGVTNEEFNGQGNNQPFAIEKPTMTILFGDSPYRGEIQGVTGGFNCCGIGAYVGIRAQFIETLVLGRETIDPLTYCVLC